MKKVQVVDPLTGVERVFVFDVETSWHDACCEIVDAAKSYEIDWAMCVDLLNQCLDIMGDHIEAMP